MRQVGKQLDRKNYKVSCIFIHIKSFKLSRFKAKQISLLQIAFINQSEPLSLKFHIWKERLFLITNTPYLKLTITLLLLAECSNYFDAAAHLFFLKKWVGVRSSPLEYAPNLCEKYEIRMKVTNSYKHSSLLRYRNNSYIFTMQDQEVCIVNNLMK